MRRPGRKDYLAPERAVAEMFRARFLALARNALPAAALPEVPWAKSWVVHIERPRRNVPAERLLAYLGRYVHRTAITDKRILACDDDSVSFTYRDSRDGRRKTMTLSPDEFLRRFLQHVPPRGFHRVRAYGLLHPRHRTTLARLQLLLVRPKPTPAEPHADDDAKPPAPRRSCPACKTGTLRLLLRLSAAQCRAWSAAHPGPTDAVVRTRAPP